jgi:hypothetical protein
MKAILLLTGFTENAAQAVLSGVTLCQKMHTNLLLFNVNSSQQVIPQYAGGLPLWMTLAFGKTKVRRSSIN